jgi:hypothetical protein
MKRLPSTFDCMRVTCFVLAFPLYSHATGLRSLKNGAADHFRDLRDDGVA